MRRALSIAAVVLCFALVASTAEASCIFLTPAQKRARADVIFNGVALEGPTSTGIQRFRVIRYLKGSGPSVVRVGTGNVRRPDGSGTVTSVSLIVKRGQKWRIFGRGSARKIVRTSVCDGSRRL